MFSKYGFITVCALLPGTVLFRYGIGIDALKYMVLILLLLVASVYDISTMEVPDRFWICGTFVWAVLFVFSECHPRGGKRLLPDGTGGYMIRENIRHDLIMAASGAFAVPLFLLLISLILEMILKRETIGFADIKILFMTGLYLGPIRNILNIFLMAAAGLAGCVLLLRKDEEFPLVPSIAISTLTVVLAGDEMISWYVSVL